MNYITAELIKNLREKRKLTQKMLAEQLMVSDKTVSKWETGKGLPDIGIVEDLATVLGISVAELFTGDYRENDNPSANMKKTHFYVCPICGNVINSIGKGSFSCCGVMLPELEPEEMDEEHCIQVELVENEYFITMKHEMSKQHYISFVANATSDHVEMVKLYPEQDVAIRLRRKGHGWIYAYCNRHGLYRIAI